MLKTLETFQARLEAAERTEREAEQLAERVDFLEETAGAAQESAWPPAWTAASRSVTHTTSI